VDVLVLGSGAREHALAWRLARDEAVRRVRIAPGNGGTDAVAERVDVDIVDPTAVARHAARERYALVVVGPEAPLAAGVADAVASAGVAVFGPSRAAARLESSKSYAREQLRRAGVPTAEGASFSDMDAAIAHLRAMETPPVVKADGLASGKGVVVAESHDEAEDAVRMLLGVAEGRATVVLEERLHGREVSAFALVSDRAVVPLAAACDYKRLRNDDAGPNTGGMGAYAPVPWFDGRALEDVAADVFEPVAWRMSRDGVPYRGVLYAGLMLTADGPRVLEFNVRFGDPEAEVILPLVDGDLAAALVGTATGDRGLMEGSIAMRRAAAVAVVIASAGYPDAPETGRGVTGAEPSSASDDGDVLVFHGATRRATGGAWESTGGRVLTMVGRGDDLPTARAAAYRAAEAVELDGAQMRTDVAARDIVEAAVRERVESVR
jgi:phosphoribosylamine---glycine ligase